MLPRPLERLVMPISRLKYYSATANRYRLCLARSYLFVWFACLETKLYLTIPTFIFFDLSIRFIDDMNKSCYSGKTSVNSAVNQQLSSQRMHCLSCFQYISLQYNIKWISGKRICLYLEVIYYQAIFIHRNSILTLLCATPIRKLTVQKHSFLHPLNWIWIIFPFFSFWNPDIGQLNVFRRRSKYAFSMTRDDISINQINQINHPIEVNMTR